MRLVTKHETTRASLIAFCGFWPPTPTAESITCIPPRSPSPRADRPPEVGTHAWGGDDASLVLRGRLATPKTAPKRRRLLADAGGAQSIVTRTDCVSEGREGRLVGRLLAWCEMLLPKIATRDDDANGFFSSLLFLVVRPSPSNACTNNNSHTASPRRPHRERAVGCDPRLATAMQ